MTKYEKINTLWKRDLEGKFGPKGNVIVGDFSKEEFAMINEWEVTEKIDGMNIRVGIVPWNLEGTLTKPHFSGRTDKANIPEPLLGNLKEMFEDISLTDIFDLSKAGSVTIYGEGYGAKIQSGGKYIPDNQDFIVFDILIDGIWLASEHVTDLCNQMKLKRVPIIGRMTTDEIVEFVKSEPQSALGDFTMEGVVFRTNPLLLDRMGRRVAGKLKVRDFR